jgi:hypothetical protein
MRVRFFALTVALLLVLSACGGNDGGERQELSYSLDPGTTLSYDTELGIDMTVELDVPADLLEGLGGGEIGSSLDLTEPITIDMVIGLDMDLAVAEGDSEGLREVTVTLLPSSLVGSFAAGGETSEFDLAIVDGEVTGTVTTNGETEEVGGAEDLPDDLGIDPSTLDEPAVVVFVIDAEGTIVDVEAEGDAMELGDLGDITTFTEFSANSLLVPITGPAFPDEAVGVGSDWSTDITIGEGTLSLDRETTYEIAASEERQGRESLRIEAEGVMSGLELDLADIVQLLTELVPPDPDAEIDPAQTLALLEAFGVQVGFELRPTTESSTLWFDAAAGVVVEMDTTTSISLDAEVSGVPDMGDIAVAVDGSVTQKLVLDE